MPVAGNHWLSIHRNGKIQGDIGKALIASATHLHMVVRDETGRTKGTPTSETAGPRKFGQMTRSHGGASLCKTMAKQAGE